MKKLLIYVCSFIITGIFIVILSCNESIEIIDDNADNDVTCTDSQDKDEEFIIEAQNYFETEVQFSEPVSSTKKGNKPSIRRLLRKSLLWEEAYVKQLSFGEGIVIPILYEMDLYVAKGNRKIPLNDLSYVLIYLDYNWNWHTEIVTTLPDEAYSNSFDEDQPFSGGVIIEDWHGNFIKGYTYEEGKVTDVIINNDSNTKWFSGECWTTEYQDCISFDGGNTWSCTTYAEETWCGSGASSGGTIGGEGDYPPSGGSTGNTDSDSDNDNNDEDTPEELVLPCNTGDDILDDSGIQESLSSIWEASSVGGIMSARKEQGGWIVENNGSFSFVPYPDDWQRTACGIQSPSDWLSDVPDNAVAMVHTHPFYQGEDTRSVCGDEGEASYQGGPSWDDCKVLTEIASETNNFALEGYVIDGNNISKYNWKSVANTENIEKYVRCGY